MMVPEGVICAVFASPHVEPPCHVVRTPHFVVG